MKNIFFAVYIFHTCQYWNLGILPSLRNQNQAENKNGKIFGHPNLKHGRPDKADEFLKLFFCYHYNIPTYGSPSDYSYTATTQEGLNYLHGVEKNTLLENSKKYWHPAIWCPERCRWWGQPSGDEIWAYIENLKHSVKFQKNY